MPTFSTEPIICSFDVVVLQGTAKKYTKMYNARAGAFFFALVLAVVAVVVA